MSSVSIEALHKSYGSVAAIDRVSLQVAQGEMLVLVGPSGCGKTTTLRCVAGLETPTSGSIRIGEQVVSAPERGIFVPPERREIGMVFQSYAVWPHMTVFGNVAYPLRAMGMAKAEISSRVTEALRLTRLEGLADRYSSQISGGQQQRVALARSLVARPRLLLFDEPLSNLDARLRIQMREEIRDLQRRLEFTALYVTHDQAEAMAIADRIAVLDGGRIRQLDTPQAIYEKPASAFVATFMGSANLFPGVVRGADAEGTVIALEGGLAARVVDRAEAGRRVQVSIRPEVLRIAPNPSGAADEWHGEVKRATYVGNVIVYRVQVGPHLVEVHAPPGQFHAPGAQVWLAATPAQRIMIAESPD